MMVADRELLPRSEWKEEETDQAPETDHFTVGVGNPDHAAPLPAQPHLPYVRSGAR